MKIVLGGPEPPQIQRGGVAERGSKGHKLNSSMQISENHLEERLLDQAQARALYTPLFGGRLRSIPQGMVLGVRPLVKSLFCPIKRSPNRFFDSEASMP